ncbi:M16 family metallopeptidase [Neorickettsia sennetsu]|uniref:Peptidase, M16 family n=1 Tax=Ehrlichia sennetsu (strain ATCC VR-367 / Miyayama) TaxID=222891 RepID=Q2GCL9_EHRS3|nr:pitrilysin family protein [Neorickettsia sennetsu]ABD46296.1 peptidase, M16 family [Neorickettsia sennetsu str. Miyayama]
MLRGIIFVLFFLVCGFSHAVDSQTLFKITEVESKYGVRAWFVPKNNVPLVFYSFVFKGGGYAYDPKAKLGLAALIVEVLNEGISGTTNRDFEKSLEKIGGKIVYDLGADNLVVTVSAPKESIKQAIELFCASVAKPKLDDETLSKVKGRHISQLKRDKGDPVSIAKTEFFKVVFPDSGYSNVRWGRVETVDAIKADDIKAKIVNVFNRINMSIAVLGNTHADDIKSVLDDYLIEFPLTMMEVKKPEQPVFRTSGECISVEKNIPQNVILFGHSGLSPTDEDFYNLVVLNHILGGPGLESLLMQEIRERKGYTYGIYTKLWHSAVNFLFGFATTSNDNAPQVREGILTVLNELKRSGLTSARVEEAKSHLVNMFVLKMDKSTNMLGMLVQMQQEGLGIDYVEKYLEGIRRVKVENLNLFIKSFLNPQSVLFVNVGAIVSPITGAKVCPK